MARFPSLCGALAVLLVGVLAGWPQLERWRFEARASARLHAHFARVGAELARRDVSALGPAQRASRARLLALLRDYDRQGRFPRNEGQRTGPTPIFVDRHETRCAMAWLIEHSGGAALVARIAATANLARIPELAGDAELGRWLANAGLDLAEAARIQPNYDPPGPGPLPPKLRVFVDPGEEHVPSNGVLVSSTVISAAFAARALTLGRLPSRTSAERRRAAEVALCAGAGSLGLGLVDALNDTHLRGAGYANLALGASTVALGLHELHRARLPDKPDVRGPGLRAALEVRSGQTGEPQLGLQLSF